MRTTNFSLSFKAVYAENYKLAFLSHILKKGTVYFIIFPSKFSGSEWISFPSENSMLDANFEGKEEWLENVICLKCIFLYLISQLSLYGMALGRLVSQLESI